MIDTGRLKSDNRIVKMFNKSEKRVKALSIHREIAFINQGKRRINNGEIKLIFGNINTDKKVRRKVLHITPHKSYLGCPESGLLIDSGFQAKSTDRDLRDGGQTPFEALRLRKNGVLCPSFLLTQENVLANIKYQNY